MAIKTRNCSSGNKNFRYTKEAITYGRDIAIHQQSELVIHDRHGRIRDKDSYGNDPCPPKDTKF